MNQPFVYGESAIRLRANAETDCETGCMQPVVGSGKRLLQAKVHDLLMYGSSDFVTFAGN